MSPLLQSSQVLQREKKEMEWEKEKDKETDYVIYCQQAISDALLEEAS